MNVNGNDRHKAPHRGGAAKRQAGLERRERVFHLTDHVAPAEREAAARGGPCPVRGCDVVTPPAVTFTGQTVSWHYDDPPDRE